MADNPVNENEADSENPIVDESAKPIAVTPITDDVGIPQDEQSRLDAIVLSILKPGDIPEEVAEFFEKEFVKSVQAARKLVAKHDAKLRALVAALEERSDPMADPNETNEGAVMGEVELLRTIQNVEVIHRVAANADIMRYMGIDDEVVNEVTRLGLASYLPLIKDSPIGNAAKRGHVSVRKRGQR